MSIVSYIVHNIIEDLVENKQTVEENQRRTEEKLDKILASVNANL